MEIISSRKNEYIRHLRLLAADGDYRRKRGEYICEGIKTLHEALNCGAWILSVLWKGEEQSVDGLVEARQYVADAQLFDYASFSKDSPGPLFTVKMPLEERDEPLGNGIILDGVQDPGNVGTVIRTANAFAVDAVILTGGCADVYNPKTVRASMGAIFRQRILHMTAAELKTLGLRIYGAALTDNAIEIGEAKLDNAAVAIGSEGRGLSREVLELCDARLIIPMEPCSESLNAAVAAGIAMWEMKKQKMG